jgi:translation initiation factor IF-3
MFFSISWASLCLRVELLVRRAKTAGWSQDLTTCPAPPFDLRFTKILNLGGGTRLRAMFDLFNLFNANTVMAETSFFGDDWLTPQVIMPGRLAPVCKIMDYGKFKYSAQKKAAEARKKQKVVEIKEIKLRPMIDDHDYDVKMRAMQRFFEEGDKVKITLRYRGREMAHQEIGTKLLDKVKADVAEFAKVEQDARFEGRQVVMVLAPR